MTVKILARRLDRIQAALPRPPKDRYDFSFRPEYFTQDERERLIELLTKITEPDSMFNLPVPEIAQRLKNGALTFAELDEIWDYAAYHEAMEAGNTKESARLRVHLNTLREELIARFLALDLSHLPEGHPGIEARRGNIRYHLSRTWHRHHAREIARDDKQHIDLNTLWVWIEHYQEVGWL